MSQIGASPFGAGFGEWGRGEGVFLWLKNGENCPSLLCKLEIFVNPCSLFLG